MSLRNVIKEAKEIIEKQGGEKVEFSEEDRELIDQLIELFRLDLEYNDDFEGDSQDAQRVNQLIVQVSNELNVRLNKRA